MTVPFTGALIMAIGTWFFFFSPRLLYAAMIVSIPFSATAVANLRWGGEDKGIAAWLFLGVLWALRGSLSGQPLWHRAGWFLSSRARNALLVFVGAVFASLCVPLLSNGTSWIPAPSLVGSETVALRFGSYNLTQTAYLVLGVLLAIFAAAENVHSPRFFYTLKLYVSSCVFAAGWGLFELWCEVTGHSYPAYLFNTNANISALGYQEVLGLGAARIGRVSSVALEPSVLAEELLLAFVVLLVSMGLQRHLLSKKWDYIAFALIGVTLLASTSTTAYAGMFVALFAAAFTLYRAGRPSKPYIIAAGIAFGVAALAAAILPFFMELTGMLVLNKLEGGSGLLRTQSIALAAQDFLRFPILGAGWHSVACWDLLFLLLANTGLIGLISFALFLVPILRRLWILAAEGKPTAVVLLSALVLMLVLAEAAGLTYAAAYPWFIFGLGAGAVVAARKECALASRLRTGISVRGARALPRTAF